MKSVRLRGEALLLGRAAVAPETVADKMILNMNTDTTTNAPPVALPSESQHGTRPGLTGSFGQSPPAIGPADVGPAFDVPQRSLRVLCIDDDEQILEVMKGCLAHFQHQVRVASGGKYGIELFRTAILKSEPYDIVITDLNMPDVNGYVVAQAIKAESPVTPIILMTGRGNQELGAVLRSAPVDAVVEKPPRIRELNEILLRMARPA